MAHHGIDCRVLAVCVRSRRHGAQLAYFGVSVMHILISVKMSYSFGHGVGYALGLIFLTPIFLLILAFDESVYIGPGGKKETDREMYR